MKSLIELGKSVANYPRDQYPSAAKINLTPFEKKPIAEDDFLLYMRRADGLLCVGLSCGGTLTDYVKVKVFNPFKLDMYAMMDNPTFIEDNKSQNKMVLIPKADVYSKVMLHNVVYGPLATKQKKETILLTGRGRYLFHRFYRELIEHHFPDWVITQHLQSRA